MTALARRGWVPETCEALVQAVARDAADVAPEALDATLDELIAANRRIHEVECVNLNPATNVMNPRAEAAQAAGLGSRPSLGYPGDKYEMGLEAIERIEVIAAELAAEVFGARYAEVRVASGALANLYAFMACCEPGDSIIAPPDLIGGHVTHHAAGAAGLYRLKTHPAPVLADGYTVDVAGVRKLAKKVRPKLITIGGSLNLAHHPVAELHEVAEEVGAKLLFDAAHLCGMIAGGQWPNPLIEGADLITMSTYKSLGGPAGGLIVTNDKGLAEKLDRIAFPGLTANFDAGRVAALAITMLDWRVSGADYAAEMVATAAALAEALAGAGAPVFAPGGVPGGVPTISHQFALEAAGYGGGQAAAKRLRRANILTCGIGLPIAPVEGDMNGLRLGTPEIVRWGMRAGDMPDLAGLVMRGLGDAPETAAAEVMEFRSQFREIGFARG